MSLGDKMVLSNLAVLLDAKVAVVDVLKHFGKVEELWDDFTDFHGRPLGGKLPCQAHIVE